VAPTGGLTQTRADTATDATLGVLCTVSVLNGIEFHDFASQSTLIR
jgi:hypothetical protein